MKSPAQCEKTLPMLMVGQEQFLITLFNFHGNAGNLKPAQDQFSRLKSVHHSLDGWKLLHHHFMEIVLTLHRLDFGIRCSLTSSQAPICAS